MEDSIKVTFGEEDFKRIRAIFHWGVVKISHKEKGRLELLNSKGRSIGEMFVFDKHSRKLELMLEAQKVCVISLTIPEIKEKKKVEVNTKDGYLDLRNLVIE